MRTLEYVRCAIYTRVSKAEDGDSSSTDRQEKNCRRLIGMREWEAAEVFTDIDRSAYKPGSLRSSLERLLRSVEDQDFDAVVVWKLDRLTRRSQDFERIWAICEASNTALVSVTEPVDTSSPIGVAVVRMLVTFAGLESTVRSQRLAAKHLEDAQAGIPRSTHRPFGYTREMEIVADEAELLREAAGRVIEGESVQLIARDWTARGLRATRGGEWQPSALRQVLLSPRLVGDRAHKGDVVATDCWDPILSRRIADGVREALVGGRAVRRRRKGHPSTLGGLVECAECGELLVVVLSNDEYRYRCQRVSGGCGNTSVRSVDLEGFVVHHVRWRLTNRSHTPGRTVSYAEDLRAVSKALRDRESKLLRINAAYFMDGALTQPEWRRLRAGIVEASELEIRRAEPERRPAALPEALSWRSIASEWGSLSAAAHRAAVGIEVQRITVRPGDRQDGRTDLGRITVEWVRQVDGSPPLFKVRSGDRMWVYENRQARVPSWVPPASELRAAGRPLSAPEACRVADVLPKRFQRAVRNGRLKVTGTGPNTRVELGVLDDWSAAGAPQSSSPSTAG